MDFNELSELEKKAYDLILKRGKKGIFQNDLWKELGISSREASRVVIKLVKRGLIIRKPAVNRGRKTYLLLPAPPKKREKIKHKLELTFITKIDIRNFLDIPCVKCPFIDKCYRGGFYDPTNCPWIEEWILREISKMKATTRPR